MSLIINFVGIIYFHANAKDRRLAIIPNGDTANGLVTRHRATIEIEAERITGESGWPAGSAQSRKVNQVLGRMRREAVVAKLSSSAPQTDRDVSSDGETDESVELRSFPITERSVITITGVEGKAVDTSEHDELLPKLMDLEPPVVFDPPSADILGSVSISNGRLLARRLPTEDGKGAIVSQLRVDGKLGPITITVTHGKYVRTITVSDDTEIVIANVSGRPSDDDTGEAGHFQLYRKLAPEINKKAVEEPKVRPDVPPLDSLHPFIVDPFDAPGERCSNTCCGKTG